LQHFNDVYYGPVVLDGSREVHTSQMDVVYDANENVGAPYIRTQAY